MIAAHEEGEILLTLSDGQNMTGVIWMESIDSPNKIVIYLGQNGYPETGYIGDYILLFRNYTQDSVDIAIVAPDGSVSIERNVYIGADKLSELSQLSRSLLSSHSLTSSRSFTWNDLAKTVRIAGIVVGAFTCAAAVMTVIASPAGVACAAALITTVSAHYWLNNVDNLALESTSTSLGAIGCGTGLAGDPFTAAVECTNLALDLGGKVIDAFKSDENERETEINLAESSLIFGGGDVQVTLTWDNSSDLDIWVVDPNNEIIKWDQPSSASGGELDADDRNGFGPENIFWPSGQAPSGTYEVRLAYFTDNGQGAANYEILVQADGSVTQYSEPISKSDTPDDDDSILITTFTR